VNKKYALCVGNNYPNTSAELFGCVNDANDWSRTLRDAGYVVGLMTEAAKGDVMDALTEMIANAGFGDRVVFTYSGHGTWMPDTDGDEVDGRDEAMVMADYMEGGLLLDDELHRIFSVAKYGVGKLILSDSCHSGTLARVMVGATPPQMRRIPKFLSPATFTDLDSSMVKTLERQLKVSKPRPSASLISGCEDAELSYDASFSGRSRGAFTHYALDAYKPGIKLGAWHNEIRKRLPNSWLPQSPALTTQTSYRRYIKAI